jgi:archaellum component FlaC
MALEVETIVAVSLMMAVFSAVAAVGTSIVLGAGFERLRTGFEVISKQTGFFSDAIHKLEGKVEDVDKQTQLFTKSVSSLEAKVTNVGDQANVFADTMLQMGKKVETVDKQTAFFSDAIHKLESKVEMVNEHEEVVAEKLKVAADTDMISAGKAEALVAHAEDLLLQVSTLATKIETKQDMHAAVPQAMDLHLPDNLSQFSYHVAGKEEGQISFH